MNSVLAILLISSCVLVSARSHHKRNQNDDAAFERCFDNIMSCQVHFVTFAGGAEGITQYLSSGGTLRSLCGEAMSGLNCFESLLSDEECSQFLPPPAAMMLSKIKPIAQYVCEEKIDEIQDQQECLLNAEVDEEMAECQEENFNFETCDVSSFMTCISSGFDQTDSCGEESEQLVEDIFKKLVTLIPGCEERRAIKRTLTKMFLRK